MPTLSIQDVQARLPELIAKMQPGEEIIITQEQKPVARLVGEKKTAPFTAAAGNAQRHSAIHGA